MNEHENTDPGLVDALRWAYDRALPDLVDLGDDRAMLRRRTADGGYEWLQVDKRAEWEGPRRAKGTIVVHDASSFVVAVNELATEVAFCIVYRDETSSKLVAVLNERTIAGEPGWRDHRVELELTPTPEWVAWKGGAGLGSQERFAERIEDGLPEIVEPAAATMLEIAESFHATVGASFQRGARNRDGAASFVYTEQIDAKAGAAGDLTIPGTFVIVVRPFYGADSYRVEARLRYRLKAGELSIGYDLVRPAEVERDAFAGIAGQVADELSTATHLAGRPNR